MVNYTGKTIGTPSLARKRMEVQWDLPRTLRGGTPAMRIARVAYLPMTESEQKKPKRYDDRLARARLRPGYSRAITDLAALPFQKEPTIKGLESLPPETQKLQANADRSGTSLWAFFRQIHDDAIDRGAGLFLVDNVPTTVIEPMFETVGDGLFDDAGNPRKPVPVLDAEGHQVMHETTMSKPDAERLDARPYFVRIHPDSLVGMVVETRGGRETIVDLRTRDRATVIALDGAEREVERIKHWTPTTFELWEAVDRTPSAAGTVEATAENQTEQDGYRLVETRPHGFLDGIPLIVHYTNRIGPGEANPPLTDLAWENVAHWQSQGGHTEALQSGRYPILAGRNLSSEAKESKPVVGPGATILDDTDAEWSFIEPSGASFDASEKDLARIEANMAWMAMQPLVQTNGPTTATGEVRADVREKALAQQWSEGLEWAMYRAFSMAVRWLNQTLPEEFSVALFRDFAILSPTATQDLLMLQTDVREGRLTLGTYLAELKRRGKLHSDWDPVAEEQALDEQKAASEQARMDAMAAQFKNQEAAAAAGGNPQAGEGGGKAAA